ncbi:hypothetical protein TCAP_06451 [Tolypocladium capitatum]|uniref:Uncharacterized protein n=1 Tax=Tolypocladium capitatum TaxID=45235 RepID=A0A2K3Q7Z8_9HYPO|nr:hypothetical protein TCAP_06451 [Tolypocladium capitatum]
MGGEYFSSSFLFLGNVSRPEHGDEDEGGLGSGRRYKGAALLLAVSADDIDLLLQKAGLEGGSLHQLLNPTSGVPLAAVRFPNLEDRRDRPVVLGSGC